MQLIYYLYLYTEIGKDRAKGNPLTGEYKHVTKNGSIWFHPKDPFTFLVAFA